MKQQKHFAKYTQKDKDKEIKKKNKNKHKRETKSRKLWSNTMQYDIY